MKKKLLKLTITFLVLLKSSSLLFAVEDVVIPKKKPIINKEQISNKIDNYLIPLKKPANKKRRNSYKKTKNVNSKW